MKKQTRLQIFEEAVSHDEVFQIIRAQVKKALKGDTASFDRVMDNRYGKLVEKVDLGIELGAGSAEIARRYAQRVAAKGGK